MKYLLILLLLVSCSKQKTKVCYACQQGFSAGGIPPRNFDTCFNSEEEFRNHRWVDSRGNDLTVSCQKK